MKSGRPAQDHHVHRAQRAHAVAQADDLAHIVEVLGKSPRCPAQHGIDIAAAQQHRGDQRRAVAHALARQRLGHAAAAHEVIILAPAFLIPAIVFKTDDLAVATVLKAQPQGLNAGIDDVRDAPQERVFRDFRRR
jgi:hypothetical protein